MASRNTAAALTESRSGGMVRFAHGSTISMSSGTVPSARHRRLAAQLLRAWRVSLPAADWHAVGAASLRAAAEAQLQFGARRPPRQALLRVSSPPVDSSAGAQLFGRRINHRRHAVSGRHAVPGAQRSRLRRATHFASDPRRSARRQRSPAALSRAPQRQRTDKRIVAVPADRPRRREPRNAPHCARDCWQRY